MPQFWHLWCPTHFRKFWGDTEADPCPWCEEDNDEMRHPQSARFHEVLAELANLHDRKQADYGRDNDPFSNVRASEEWGVEPWVGAMIRLTDKVRRLQKAATGKQLVNEGVIDSLNDIAVYAVIARVLYEQRGGSDYMQCGDFEAGSGSLPVQPGQIVWKK